jgi:alkylation response protein AidB-like acyl-CoA dehydrogenase
VDLTLTPDEEAFRDDVRTWLEANHPGPEPDGDDSAKFQFQRDWQLRMHEDGWAGISWPKEYGGRGASLLEQTIFYSEMARANVPRPANILGLVMGGPVVMAHGDESQKERFLEPILSAREIWCQGFSEPESGSDLASLKTKATRVEGGWAVTGQKVWTTLAHVSKWCMLVARTDPDVPKHKGLTYFICDMEQDGIEVRPLVQITGEAEFNEVFFNEAFIPDENVIGGVGNGWMVAITTLMNERAGLGASAAVGIANDLEALIGLINERGLGSDPMLRQRVAKLKMGAEALRLGALRSLSTQMQTGIPGPEGSLLKWQWGAINQELTELATDVLGPEGLDPEEEWTYKLLRSRANSIEGGTTEVLKNIIAERVLGLPKLR